MSSARFCCNTRIRDGSSARRPGTAPSLGHHRRFNTMQHFLSNKRSFSFLPPLCFNLCLCFGTTSLLAVLWPVVTSGTFHKSSIMFVDASWYFKTFQKDYRKLYFLTTRNIKEKDCLPSRLICFFGTSRRFCLIQIKLAGAKPFQE